MKINWDEPAIFDHDRLYLDVCDLMAGKSIRRRGYDYTRHPMRYVWHINRDALMQDLFSKLAGK